MPARRLLAKYPDKFVEARTDKPEVLVAPTRAKAEVKPVAEKKTSEPVDVVNEGE